MIWPHETRILGPFFFNLTLKQYDTMDTITDVYRVSCLSRSFGRSEFDFMIPSSTL